MKSNLTFNYGLRYDVSSPWKEKYNQIQTLIPGEQSVVFPGSPTGWVFPGDPDVPSTLAPTRWNNFAPRLGLAYSFGDYDGLLGKILGKSGTTSLRAGWGIFYSTFEGATDFNEIGDAPFGNYTGQNQPTFAAPFTNRAAGTSITNFFPVTQPPLYFSAKNPASGPPFDNLTDFFNAFGTIGSSPAFYNKNRLPYAEEYELSIEHQITRSDLLTVSYVGTQAHRLLSSESANPGSPSLCLQLAAAGAIAVGTTNTTCGPGNENLVYALPGGGFQPGTRLNFPGTTLPNGTPIVPFGNDSYFITAGSSSYNSVQINYRHTSGRLQTLIGYTLSKSFDDSSGYGEQINPINHRLSRGLSAFDSTHNFVASYNYTLPIDKLSGPKRLTNGWIISGITKFATGLPVTLVETDDQSLLGTGFGGPITLPVDTPDQIATGCKGESAKDGRPILLDRHRSDPQLWAPKAMPGAGSSTGRELTIGTLRCLKTLRSRSASICNSAAEFFNIFNHTQFLTPSGITGFSIGTGGSDIAFIGVVRPSSWNSAGTHRPAFFETVFLDRDWRRGRISKRIASRGDPEDHGSARSFSQVSAADSQRSSAGT